MPFLLSLYTAALDFSSNSRPKFAILHFAVLCYMRLMTSEKFLEYKFKFEITTSSKIPFTNLKLIIDIFIAGHENTRF